MMTRPELARRMATANFDDFVRAVQKVREGYGGHTITIECGVTLKQANAAFEWVRRYGDLEPHASYCTTHRAVVTTEGAP